MSLRVSEIIYLAVIGISGNCAQVRKHLWSVSVKVHMLKNTKSEPDFVNYTIMVTMLTVAMELLLNAVS